jgi:ABC-type antimicrobial peptide transport system ATPase subunit
MNFLPKYGEKDPEQKEKLGMQLDKNLVAAQFATRWVQKFVLRLTYLADQLEVGGIADMN